MDDIKDTISKNLVELRTQAKLTQLQLAEMLNYSDKAVSKWERGEAIPDVRVLLQLAELYGISLDDLIRGKDVSTKVKPGQRINSKHAFVAALSVLLVWFVATGVFALVYFIPEASPYAWMVFIAAPIPTGIVLTVFSAMWGNRITKALSSSLILWACVVLVHVYVSQFIPDYKQLFVLYIVAGVFEVLIIVWFVYRWYVSRKK